MIVDFSKFSSVKIGGVFELLELDENSWENFDGVVVGGANNLLISPNPPRLGMLDKKFDYIKLEGEILRIGGATKSAKIYNFARKNSLGGFEFIKNIPGTLGGIITMNAGVKGHEISQNLLYIRTSMGKFRRDECGFGYRKSGIKGVIFEAVFMPKGAFDDNLSNTISKLRSNQPKGASFGSCFKNPPNISAGALLESVGLRGFRLGACGFSDMHANFLINYGGAKFDEAIALIGLAKTRVFEKSGITLEEEVRIL